MRAQNNRPYESPKEAGASVHIESPDLEALERKMARTDPVQVYQRAARQVGTEMERDVARAVHDAGGSERVVDAVGVYDDAGGEIYVGVPGTSRSAAEMAEIEFGTVLHAPAAPIRRTVLGREHAWRNQFGDALTTQLIRALS